MPRHLSLALLLGLGGGVATAAVIPYVLVLQPEVAAAVPVSLPVFMAAQGVQGFVVLTLMAWAGLAMGRSLGLDAPYLRALVERTPMPTPRREGVLAVFGFGVLGAIGVVGLDRLMTPELPEALSGHTPHPSAVLGALASLYGGIAEELQLRLFVMSGVAALLARRLRPAPDAPAPDKVYWLAAGVAALLFGLGHLPAAAAIWPLTPMVVARVLLLNGLLGLPFGWVFWRYGLEHAMVAHLLADLVLHVITVS